MAGVYVFGVLNAPLCLPFLVFFLACSKLSNRIDGVTRCFESLCCLKRVLGEACLDSGPGGGAVTPGFKPFPFHRNVFLCGQVEEK